VPTTREVPAEAEIVSHRLMIRAGLIRKLASGTYSYLPLGFRSLMKAIGIVREEMDAAGGQEVLLPALQPLELWEKSGRDIAFGENLMRVEDRHGRSNVLGPTHEEVITEIVANHLSSYKQLPQCFYQIQTKFRDEFRPRFGVLRSREFLMKDAYSFHASEESLDETYQRLYQAYGRICSRCGLAYRVVEAESGPIGGSGSHEFMVATDAGEDVIVTSKDGNYAASRARAQGQPLEKGASEEQLEIAEVATPNVSTVEQLTEFLKISASGLIKTLIYEGQGSEGNNKVLIAALVRGDHEVHESKLARAAGVAQVVLAGATVIEKVTGAKVGFAGPVGLDSSVRVICDQAVSVMQNAVTGANKSDTHYRGVNPGRDFEVKDVADIRYVAEGDVGPDGAALEFSRGIEIGHVFKLGSKYSRALGAEFLDEKGKSHPMIMGCYGIGVNRILAAAIETSYDEWGIIWPISIAPFEVLITCVNQNVEEVAQAAERIYDALRSKGIDVLLDDRAMRGGAKFKDADLIGIPVRVTVGKKRLEEGQVEVKLRRDAEGETAALDEVAERVAGIVERLNGELRGEE